MTNTVPIQALSANSIREALREALRSEAPVLATCDFVSSVDWSGFDSPGTEVALMLGELEQLTTDVLENVIADDAFLDRIAEIGAAASVAPAS